MTRTRWPARPNYPPSSPSGLVGVGVVFALATILLLLCFGCASVKPCPPPPAPSVIEVKVPVVVPWPSPPTITPPALQTPNTEASGATIDIILRAVLNDLDEWKRVAQQAMTALEAYRVQPKSQEAPQKP